MPPQLKAVLAHELCHARRRDNLTSAVHMIVEAVFWFHPLVWWIGARLVEERERGCDEAVLSLGSEPLDYAEGILTICKSYVESPLSLVSGVTGANLKKRIHAILTGRIAADLNFAKKLALAAAAIATVASPIAVGIMSSPGISAQARPAAPRFETASIKSCDFFRRVKPEDDIALHVSEQIARELSQGTFESECTTTERLIQQAYGLFSNGRVNPGGGIWSKNPSFSSKIMKSTVLLHTSGFDVDASRTCCVKLAPWIGLALVRSLGVDGAAQLRGCSRMVGGGRRVFVGRRHPRLHAHRQRSREPDRLVGRTRLYPQLCGRRPIPAGVRLVRTQVHCPAGVTRHRF